MVPVATGFTRRLGDGGTDVTGVAELAGRTESIVAGASTTRADGINTDIANAGSLGTVSVQGAVAARRDFRRLALLVDANFVSVAVIGQQAAAELRALLFLRADVRGAIQVNFAVLTTLALAHPGISTPGLALGVIVSGFPNGLGRGTESKATVLTSGECRCIAAHAIDTTEVVGLTTEVVIITLRAGLAEGHAGLSRQAAR